MVFKSAKKLVFSISDLLFLPLFLRLANRHRPTVFLYHGVYPKNQESGIFNYRKKFIGPEAFRRQLLWLKKRYCILPLAHIIELLKKGEGMPSYAAALTFDDGYENIYHYAFPVLKELNLPATIFVPTNLVEKNVPLWVDRLEYALEHTEKDALEIEISGSKSIFPLKSRAEKIRADESLRTALKRMPDRERLALLEIIVSRTGRDLTNLREHPAYRGLTTKEMLEMMHSGVSFAPHTVSHPILSQLPLDEARHEIKESFSRLHSQIKGVLPFFAYPNGQEEDFTSDIQRILQDEGFTAAFTTIAGTIGSQNNLFALSRITLDGTDDMQIFRLTATGVRHMLGRAFKLLQIHKMSAGKFFHETAEDYLAEYGKNTLEGYSFRERKELTLQMLGDVEGKTLLDVGSGPGIFMEELLKRGAEITAVDLAPKMIELLKKRFSHPRLKAETGDIERLRFADESFDSITALGVMEYLETDNQALREMARLLRKDGEAIISFPNRWSPWRVWNRFLLTIFKIPWRVLQRILGKKPHPISHREYTKKNILKMAQEAGLRVEEIAGYNFKVIPFPLDRIFPRGAAAIADRLKRLEKNPFNWIATAYLVKMRRA